MSETTIKALDSIDQANQVLAYLSESLTATVRAGGLSDEALAGLDQVLDLARERLSDAREAASWTHLEANATRAQSDEKTTEGDQP
jgi:hypothetical protein